MDIISRRYTFESAHHLTGVPLTHKCAENHGHSYAAEVFVSVVDGELDAAGMVIDFEHIDRAFAPIFKDFDHRSLNKTIHNPTAENVARHIAGRMQHALDEMHRLRDTRKVRVVRVTINEGPRGFASYSP